MSQPGSVSRWLGPLRAGDEAAARALWERYFARLVALARRRLAGAPRRAADEEDVALSAFGSFCRAAAAGRFPDLFDRDDLWQVRLVIAARKSANLAAREAAARRGGGRVRSEGDGGDPAGVLAREPDPALAAELADQFRHLLGLLGDDTLRVVAVRVLEGHSSEQIAAELGRSVATVERKRKLIRSLWESEVPGEWAAGS